MHETLIAWRISKCVETVSTNEDLKRAAMSGEAEGCVIQALRQTAGKGRRGRVWDSPTGNLYASVLLRPNGSPQEAGRYSFVVALAIYDAVRGFLPDGDIQLKWPNDVLVGGKKISGILLEAAPIADGVVAWLVIGTGINVLYHPEGGVYPTTSLVEESTSSLSVDTVLQSYLTHLNHWRGVLIDDGFEPIRDAWLSRAKKGSITARLPHETIEGLFHGVDANGNLILLLPDGTEKSISAADIFFPSQG